MVRILLILLLLASNVHAAVLLGDSTGDSSGSFNNNWKCVRYFAEETGRPAECRVQFHSANITHADMGCVVYLDNNGPYSILTAGCRHSCNVGALSQGDWISIPLADNDIFVEQDYYWICFTDNSNNNLWLYRANDPPASNYTKIIKGPGSPCTIPLPSFFDTAGVVTGSYNIEIHDDEGTALCTADFNGDGDVDGTDAYEFKTQFGRQDCQ